MAGPLPAPGVVGQSLRWMLRGDSPLYIRPRAAPALAGWLWRFWRHCNARDYQAGVEAVAELSAGTMRLFNELAAELPFEMHEQGILYAFLSRRTLEHVRHGAGQALSAHEVREREPALGPDVVGGFLVAGERHVRPETLVAALAEHLARDPDVTFVRTRATGLIARGGRVVAARTAEGDVVGDAFLLAAGAWSGVLGGLPVQGGKGYSVTVEAPALRLRQPVYLDEARVACSPFDGALRLAGTMELSGLDAGPDPRRVAAMTRASERYMPGWRNGRRTTAWAGLRPVTPDGLPVIGRLPDYENAFVATGHAMLGVTLAPATAAAVAELMCGGDAQADLRPFDPARFH